MAARIACAVAVAVAALLGAAAAAHGGEPPTIGAAVQSRVYLEDGRTVTVQNRSTIPVLFTLEPAAGLTAEPVDGLLLVPDEVGVFTLAGTAPRDGARLTVRVDQTAEPVPGAERTALAFGVTVTNDRPWSPPTAWLLLLVAVLLVGLVGLRRGLTRLRR